MKIFKIFCAFRDGVISAISKSNCGKLSHILRYGLYKNLLKCIGDDVLFGQGIIIKEPEKVSVGNHVSIQENCYISGYGGVSIGNHVSIGNGTKIVSSEHDYNSGKIIRNNPLVAKEVIIEDNVWVGMGVIILGGTHICEHSIIAAGAVVKGVVESDSIYAGVPARLVKKIESVRERK